MNDPKFEKFARIPLKARRLTAGFPLHSFDYIELKGGRRRMTMDEIYEITRLNKFEDFKTGPVTQTLFNLRTFIGRILRWDKRPEMDKTYSRMAELTTAERENSLIEPGTVESISKILFCFENEILFEIINRTVHCLWTLVSEETADGYTLYVAIYVKKINWRTPIYMTLIGPLLKWIVYPSMMKSVKANWARHFSSESANRRFSAGRLRG